MLKIKCNGCGQYVPLKESTVCECCLLKFCEFCCNDYDDMMKLCAECKPKLASQEENI